MGEHSTIEWTTHTHNRWWGCVHHSPACDHCYAEAWAHFQLPPGWLIVGEGREVPRRTKHGDPERPEIWGPGAPRIFPPDDSPVLSEPLRWNRKAAALGERHRVFVSSMCDIFERHRLAEVNDMMDANRAHLFGEIVSKCSSLDFLLLTKRPHDVMRLVPSTWRANWPSNVWIGATVEDQQRAAQRLNHLVHIPAPVRFVSAEPLLGPLELAGWIGQLDWVIAGGESGAGARASQIDWVRSVRDQTTSAGKAFFFKQWGPWAQRDGEGNRLVKLRRKDFRLLDGRTWDEFPVPRSRDERSSSTTEDPDANRPALARAVGCAEPPVAEGSVGRC
jgi:protein gp37